MKITILQVNNGANEERINPYEEKLLLRGRIRLSDNFASAEPSHKLIIRQEAVQEIFDFIQWNAAARSGTRVEQGGILLGRRYYDPDRDVHFAVVSKAVTADRAEGSTGYLEISHDCWMEMHEKKDRYNQETGEDAVIVGWFHTHPNMLPCFMSGTDRNTQDLFFDGDNTYSVVINPQRHLMKAFRSRECLSTQAFLLLGDAPGSEG